MPRPKPTDYDPLFENYISCTQGDNILMVMNSSWDQLGLWLGEITDESLCYSYAPNKWTLAQVLQHVIDTERVFAYRAMCIARNEKAHLPGFDEDAYAAIAPATHRTMVSFKNELLSLRTSSIALFNSFEAADLERTGFAFGHKVTTNAMGFILVGHIIHHQNIYYERYCPPSHPSR